MQDTDSYEWVPWQIYLTDINFNYISGERIDIPKHSTYQIQKSVIDI